MSGSISEISQETFLSNASSQSVFLLLSARLFGRQGHPSSAMQGFVRRHSGVIQDCAAAAGAVTLAFYGHEIDSSGFVSLGAWNLAAVVPISLFAAYATARRIETRGAPKDTIDSITHTLEAMVRGYVFPESWEENRYRAYCHRIDKGRTHLTPIAIASPFPDVAERTPLPVKGPDADGLVAAQAFNLKSPIVKEVTDPPDELNIWKDVRTVIAVPIIDIDSNDPIGTISIDTSLPKQATNFSNLYTAAVLLNAAKAVALLWRNS